jgi:Inner membrane protein YgaP-like, transmembrane domain
MLLSVDYSSPVTFLSEKHRQKAHILLYAITLCPASHSLTERANIFVSSTKKIIMKINDAIKAIAGVFIIISLLLSHFVSQYWLFFTAFVGLNLFQSSFTKWCLMEKILKKVGLQASGDSCNC